MSELKSSKRLQSRNRGYSRGPVRDVLPPVAEDDSPLTRSLDEVLLVKPAPIMTKRVSKSLDTSRHDSDGMQESSSNDSFKSAKSKLSEVDTVTTLSNTVETTQVPLEYSLPSECTLNPELTNETLPSYDEDMFQVDTLPDNTKNDCDKDEIRDILNEILQTAVDEESDSLLCSQDSLELAAAVSAATTSQAFIETLAEDSEVQIQGLMKVREEEMLANHCLKAQLEDQNDRLANLTKDLENNYCEGYSQLLVTQAAEMAVVKLNGSRQQTNLENELKDVKKKLTSAEADIAARDALELELKKKIADLEHMMIEKDKHCKEELAGLIAKLMKCEVVALAKNEVEEEMIGKGGKTNAGNNDASDFFEEASAVLARTMDPSVETQTFERLTVLSDLHGFHPSNSNLFATPPKRKRRSMPASQQNSDEMVKELTKLCDDKLLDLEKLRSENAALKASMTELKQLHDKKHLDFEKLDSEYNNLKTSHASLKKEIEEVRNELVVSNDERISLKLELETHKNSLLVMCEEHAKEMNENNSFENSVRSIQHDFDESLTLLSRITSERDKLLAKNQEILDSTNNRISALEAENLDQKNLLEKMERSLAELRAEHSLHQTKEQDSLIEDRRLSSIQAELENLRQKFANDPSVSRLSDFFNWSKVTDSTQYLEVPSWVPVHVACQTEELYLSTLEQDLSNCWTERCEVEEQLAAALAENAILRQRAMALNAASRRAKMLIDTSPTGSGWLQLRSCIKEILGELEAERDHEEGDFIDEQRRISSTDENSFIPIDHAGIHERSSPEGGRETPQMADCISDNTVPDCSENERSNDIALTNDAILDQSSNALMEMVSGLIQCLNGEESLCDGNCSFNGTLNGSFAERLLNIPDTGELCRVLHQIKDEVTRLFAISQKPDLVVAKLHEEINSLQQQVAASDKLVRSMRAFLEEQAAEREVERDDASKKIEELSELLRGKDRQLAAKTLLEQDIDSVEQQLIDAQAETKVEVEKRQSAEEKLQQTLVKVGNLRDVLEALETQISEKSQELEAAKLENLRLKDSLVQTGQRSLEMETAQRDSFSETLAYVARLEEELTSLRYKFEAVGPESLATARNAIKELDAAVARRTRDLELIQVAWNGGLSSASEEISTRDHVDATRCATPEEMALEASAGLCEDVERLKERLIKHARVEEAAIKKIKDLEQAVYKRDELQVDYEVVVRKMDSLMTENVRLKARIEEERHKNEDKIASIDLEAKIHDLEEQLDSLREESMEDKKKLMEKCRREERLQSSLEAYEADLSAETSTVKHLRERLKAEQSLRLDAEASLQEMSVKNCKFMTPHSFVGNSLTPISHGDGSVLRQAESGRDDIPFDTLPHKASWQSCSSVAALQLSPRGVSEFQSSSPSHNSSISSCKFPAVSPIQHNSTGVELNELSLLRASGKTQQERIKSLEDELKTCKLKHARTCKLMELAKKIAEDALARVRVQAESAQKELELRKEELTRLRELAVEAEASKENSLKLQNQLQEQLQKQLKKTSDLKRMLEDARKEINFVQTDRVTLTHREQELNIKKQELDEKVRELDAQRQAQQITFIECEKLKMEKELVTTQLSIRTQELESLQQDLVFKDEEYQRLLNEKEVVDSNVEAANLRIEELDVKIKNLVESNISVERNLSAAVEEIKSLKGLAETHVAEIERLKAETKKTSHISMSLGENSTFEENGESDRSRLEKLHMDAATLRACLKSSLSRSASLEAEVVIVRADLENRVNRIATLENELQGMKEKLNSADQELWRNERERDDGDSLKGDDAELMMMRVQAEEMALQLEKIKAQLARSKTKEARLRTTLEKTVEICREGAERESILKKELQAAEREKLDLKYLLDMESVATRGYERLHQHGLAAQRFQPQSYDPRSVRSAGDGQERQAEWQWTIHRLESYRKALIWQKTYLQKNGSRAESVRRRGRRLTLRTVGFMVIAILRMRYLTRRWKSRLPPLKSPPRRGERPLLLTSPPCKDPGLRVPQM